jgi:thiol-disulfide isomerase/thioredoxin
MSAHPRLVYGSLGAVAVILVVIGGYLLFRKWNQKDTASQPKAMSNQRGPGKQDGKVVFVDQKMLDNFIHHPDTNEDKPAMVLWYADWCGHCKQALPAFIEASKKDQSGSRWYAMESEHVDDGWGSWEIKGFPTVRKWKHGKWTPYEGPRTADAYDAFARQ